MNFEDIFADEGSTPPAVPDDAAASGASEESGITPEAPPAAESLTDSAADRTSGENGAIADTETEVKGEESAVETGTPEEAETEEITDEAIDKALEDKRTGKWFKNAITHTRSKLTQAEQELSGFRVYGNRDELEKLKSFREDLYGFEERDGNLVSRIPAFAERLVKTDSDRAIELVNSLVSQDSPMSPGRSIFDEILLIPEIDTALRARYQSAPASDDPNLPLIKPERHAAYQRLSKEERDDFRFMSAATQELLLKRAEAEIEKEREAQKENETRQAENIKKFNAAVEETTLKNFDAASLEFAEKLKQIPFVSDPRLNAFLQSTVYDKVLTVVTMGETFAGKRAAQDLADFGLTIPEETATLVKKLETDSRLITVAAWKKNQSAVDYYASEIMTTQKQLAGRANEIAAAVAEAVEKSTKKAATETDALLKQQKDNARPAIDAGGGGIAADSVDVSNMSFADIINSSN